MLRLGRGPSFNSQFPFGAGHSFLGAYVESHVDGQRGDLTLTLRSRGPRRTRSDARLHPKHPTAELPQAGAREAMETALRQWGERRRT